MTKYDKIFESLQSKVTSGELSLDTASVLNDIAYDKYVQESALSPLKDKLKKLKKIKDKKPGEFADNEEVIKFIDENYDDIKKATELLEKEPEKINKSDVRFMVSVVIHVCGSLVVMLGGPTAAVAGFMSLIIAPAITFMRLMVRRLIQYYRINDDDEAMKSLSKVKTSLLKLNKEKFSDEYKRKIYRTIQDIDDAEKAIYTKLNKVSKPVEESANEFSLADIMYVIDKELTEKAEQADEVVSKESVDEMKLRVYEAHVEGIITEAEKDTYLEYLNR